MEADPVRRRRRRWPFAAGALLVLGAVYLGAAAGASRATADAASSATRLAASGEYQDAIAVDRVVGTRGGPLFLFARGSTGSASLAAQEVMIQWAAALGRQGQYDEAVAVTQSVTDPRVRAQARQERATLLLNAAQAAAAKGRYDQALARLNQDSGAGTPAAVAAKVTQLLPQYQAGEAQALTASGEGADAVALLDQVTQENQAALAAPLYPAALWAAGQEELARDSDKEAATTLQRLVTSYGSSAQAAQAQSLLSQPQPVTGTIVDRNAQPISGQVRLSTHFHAEAGGYYTTGPFYYSTAAATGSFRFDGVPVGGPYTLEVYRDGDWTTYVDPSTGQPSDPVTVSPLVPVDLTFIALP